MQSCPPPQDACLRAPWQQGGAAPAYRTQAVSVAVFGDLQRHVDAAAGPTVLLVRGAAQLPAGQPLTISKPDIVITAAAEFDPAGGPFEGPALAVACGGLKTLVTIK